jgi:hypothetical protein
MAKKSKKREPIIDVDLGDNGGHVRFYDTAEAAAWIAKELEFWNWIESYNGTFHNQLKVPYRALRDQSAVRTKALTKAADPETERHNFEELLRKMFCNWKVVHSTTARAKYVEQLRAENPVEAATALMHFERQDVNLNAAEFISAVVGAILHERGITAKKTQRQSMQDLIAELNSAKKSAQDDADAFQNRTVDLIEEFG